MPANPTQDHRAPRRLHVRYRCQQQQVAFAQSVLLSRNLVSIAVVPVAVLGSNNAEIWGTKSSITHGKRASRLAKVSCGECESCNWYFIHAIVSWKRLPYPQLHAEFRQGMRGSDLAEHCCQYCLCDVILVFHRDTHNNGSIRCEQQQCMSQVRRNGEIW